MRKRYPITALIAITALALTGCVNNEVATPKATNSTESTTKDAALSAMLPKSVSDSGVLKVGTDANYAPNEFKDAQGNPVGWEPELIEAVAAKLGLKVKYQIAKFDNIIPSITGGKIDIGLSSFTDNAEREKQVDFVNYYTAGIQWATQKGKTVDPNNACGLKVAVQSGTYQDTDEVPAKSKACTDAGKAAIEIFKYDAQDDATTAAVLGKVDAVTADSPVTLYAISKTGDKLQTAGETFDTAPYGMPLAKKSELTPVIQKTIQALVDDGSYVKILEKWGTQSGALTKITVNAASGS